MSTLLWLVGRVLLFLLEAFLLLFLTYAGFVVLDGLIRRGRKYLRSRRRL